MSIVREPIPISEAQAAELIAITRGRRMRAVAICFKSQWYDVRHLNSDEVIRYLAGLTGLVVH